MVVEFPRAKNTSISVAKAYKGALGIQKNKQTNKSLSLNFIGPFAKKTLLRVFCLQKTLRLYNRLPSGPVQVVALKHS